MKKILATILSICALSAASFSPQHFFAPIKNLSANAAETASHTAIQTVANTANTAQTEQRESETLVTPNTYEQYLSLSEPRAIALSLGYKAIADGNKIYLYNEIAGEYQTYEHTANDDATKNTISDLQFADDGLLYFLDASTYLYSFNPKTFETATQTKLVCSAFDIFDNEIYFTNVSSSSQLSKTTLDNLDVSTSTLLIPNIGSKPVVTPYSGDVYYTNNGVHLYYYRADYGDVKLTAYFPSEIVSMAFTESTFAYIDIHGDFYVYAVSDILGGAINATELTPQFTQSGGFISLTAHGDNIYAVQNANVREFSPKLGDFTGFEICADSPSENRLSGATDCTLSNGLLFTADANNHRVSVYDTKSQTHLQPIATELSEIEFIAASDETVLIANKTTAALYSLHEKSYGEFLTSFTGFNGDLVGTAALYNRYYLLSKTNGYYKISQTDVSTPETAQTAVWGIERTEKKNAPPARLLTSDLYGNLYVAYATDLYKFTETEFMSEEDLTHSATGSKPAVEDIPAKAVKIAVDYKRAVYALSENALYIQNGTAWETVSLTKTLVYGQTDAFPVTSFTLGVEENETYLLYNGNLLIQTTEFNLPTVKTIPVLNCDEELFKKESAKFSVVTTAENSLFVYFDMNELANAQTFPYQFYKLEKSQTTALQIGEVNEYAILAILDKTTNRYETALVLKEFLSPLDETEYKTEYAEAAIGYLTNKVHLYKFPYLTELLTVTELPKNAKIQLLGEVRQLDYEYYLIAFETDDGTQTGYVPKTYVNLYDGTPNEVTDQTLGNEADDGSISRLTFILLGSAIICILIDFLLLRKKPSEE